MANPLGIYYEVDFYRQFDELLHNQGQLILNEAKYITLIQKVDWCDCFCKCCFENTNVYQVSTCTFYGIPWEPIGAFQEKSSCCLRLKCLAKFRCIQLELSLFGSLIAVGERSYFIPSKFCIPCKREEIIVRIGEQKIGRIQNPYRKLTRCPITEYHIFDEHEKQIYIIGGTRCQCSRYCCLRDVEGCNQVYYDISEMVGKEKVPVGQFRNLFRSSCVETLTNADTHVIIFPPKATLNHKILILFAGILIDFAAYE